MTPAIRQITAAAILPQMASAEAIARMTAIWARRVAASLRAPAAPAIPALPPVAPPQAMLAAPEEARRNESDEDTTDADTGGMEKAREVLAGAEPPEGAGTVATGEGREEETGGPTEDTTTLVEGATGRAGKRKAPKGAVS